LHRRDALGLAATAGVLGIVLLAIFSAEHSGRKAVIKQLAGTNVMAPAASALPLEQPARNTLNDHVPVRRHLVARTAASTPARARRILRSVANPPVIQVAAAAPEPLARGSDELPAPEPPPISIIGRQSESSDVSLAILIAGPTVVPSKESIRISQGRGGELLSKNSPPYPSWAKEQRLEGDVILQVLIDRQGRPKTVQFVSGSNALASAAINAVKRWRYQPLYLNGQLVEWTTTITLRFRLPEGN
jgi:TonB family protein